MGKREKNKVPKTRGVPPTVLLTPFAPQRLVCLGASPKGQISFKTSLDNRNLVELQNP